MTNTTTKRAGEVTIGDRVVERDGCAFEVTEIRREGRSFVFSLKAEKVMMLSPTHARVSVNARVRVAG